MRVLLDILFGAIAVVVIGFSLMFVSPYWGLWWFFTIAFFVALCFCVFLYHLVIEGVKFIFGTVAMERETEEGE